MQSVFHASHARTVILRATLVIAAAVPVASSHAQSTTHTATEQSTAAPADSSVADTANHRRAQMLQAVVVTASRRAPTLAEEGLFGRIARVDRERHDVVRRMAANHKLAALARWQEGEITRLETRLTYLATTVTDSITRQIDAAKGETAAIRARQQEIEARLANLEAEQIARRPSDAPSAETAPPVQPAPRRLPSGNR